MVQMVKYLPAVGKTCVRSLGWEDPLEEGMATHFSTLAWRIPMDRGAWRATVDGVAESDTTERLSTHTQLLGKVSTAYFSQNVPQFPFITPMTTGDQS